MIGHNGGPGAGHRAGLLLARERILHQLDAIEASAEGEARERVAAWRRQFEPRRFFPSRLQRCPTDLGVYDAAWAEARAMAAAKRAGQLSTLRRKLARIETQLRGIC